MSGHQPVETMRGIELEFGNVILISWCGRLMDGAVRCCRGSEGCREKLKVNNPF